MSARVGSERSASDFLSQPVDIGFTRFNGSSHGQRTDCGREESDIALRGAESDGCTPRAVAKNGVFRMVVAEVVEVFPQSVFSDINSGGTANTFNCDSLFLHYEFGMVRLNLGGRCCLFFVFGSDTAGSEPWQCSWCRIWRTL